jgi:hypothetical protein
LRLRRIPRQTAFAEVWAHVGDAMRKGALLVVRSHHSLIAVLPPL